MAGLIAKGGCRCVIENEVSYSIFDGVESILRFFELLDAKAQFTWDVQNFWQRGIFPSLQVYRDLKSVIGYVHVKGGKSGPDGQLKWASTLEDASWPIADVIHAIIADGVSPVICLNPSHGARNPEYDDWQVGQRDIAFLRRVVDPGL